MEKKKIVAIVLAVIVIPIFLLLCAVIGFVFYYQMDYEAGIAKQSLVDMYFQANQSFYTLNRRYPTEEEFRSFGHASTVGVLSEHFDSGVDNFNKIDGASFYYFAENSEDPQYFLICISYDNQNDRSETFQYGGYCNGNGFGLDLSEGDNIVIMTKTLPFEESSTGANDSFSKLVHENRDLGVYSYWNGSEWE